MGAFSTSHDAGDRKSTRLNSSHMSISYAVFCLKKKRRRVKKGNRLWVNETANVPECEKVTGKITFREAGIGSANGLSADMRAFARGRRQPNKTNGRKLLIDRKLPRRQRLLKKSAQSAANFFF